MMTENSDNANKKQQEQNNNWGWFNVLNPNHYKSRPRQSSSNTNDSDFQVIHQEISQSHDRGRLSSINSRNSSFDDHLSLEHNFVIMDDDEKSTKNTNDSSQTSPSPNNNNNETNEKNENENEDEAVMISQTLTLQSRNEELEKERDELCSETLQLRMQTQCIKQTNEHIIAAQQQELERLNKTNSELEKSLDDTQLQLKAALDEIARLKRERDNLQTKLHDICYNRLNGNMNMNNNNMVNSNNVKEGDVIYVCNHCGVHLFEASSMIERQIEIDDDGKFGCLVDCLFNNNDITMGPKICKTFLNGMFKVNQIFCDGCLSSFGWKIVEAFEEWNAYHQGKYCIDIAKIKQITVMQ